jgi:dipeptidyl-peptidase-4
MRWRRFLPVGLVLATSVAAQSAPSDSTSLSVARIYASTDFRAGTFGPLRWLDNGSAYTTLERPEGGKPGRDLVRYETESGTREVLIPAERFVPPGESAPLTIEDYTWSADGARLLVFTKSERVWRTNTRGDYWVLDRAWVGCATARTTSMWKTSPAARSPS